MQSDTHQKGPVSQTEYPFTVDLSKEKFATYSQAALAAAAAVAQYRRSIVIYYRGSPYDTRRF
jgi:hypothetical protein